MLLTYIGIFVLSNFNFIFYSNCVQFHFYQYISEMHGYFLIFYVFRNFSPNFKLENIDFKNQILNHQIYCDLNVIVKYIFYILIVLDDQVFC